MYGQKYQIISRRRVLKTYSRPKTYHLRALQVNNKESAKLNRIEKWYIRVKNTLQQYQPRENQIVVLNLDE